MMGEDKEIIHNEDAAAKKKRGCAAHCKRFWWIYLIGSLLVILLVILLILFVAVPKIAQRKMNESTIEVNSILIEQTKPESYQLSIESTIRTDGKIHADIDGFQAVMYLEDKPEHTPFTTVNFPPTTADKESKIRVSESINIANMDGFTEFNTWLVNNKTLRVTIEGKTKVKVKGLAKKYDVRYRKTVVLDALDGFRGLNVTQANINIAATQNNFNGYVTIPNHSVLTIEIGDTSFTNFLDGVDIGTVFMDDLTLRPGNNNVSMRATITQAPVLRKIQTRPACENGMMDFQMLGKNVTNNDGGYLSYFHKALASANQTVSINIGDALNRAGLRNITCRD